MNSSRFAFLLAAALTTALTACGGGGSAPPGPRLPNLIVVYSDDHGFADLGIQGVRETTC